MQTVIVSPDGRHAAIAAGRSIIFCSLGRRGPRHRVIHLAGEPRQIQFGPADTLYAACRDPECVVLVKSTGKVLWRRKGSIATDYSISASADGKWLAVGAEKSDDTLDVTLVDSQNRSEWTVSRPGRTPRVRLSANGSGVMLAYEHKVEHRDESRFERRLAYLDRTGSWTKGGAYTAPYYVSVDRDAEWAVALDAQSPSGTPRFPPAGAHRRPAVDVPRARPKS